MAGAHYDQRLAGVRGEISGHSFQENIFTFPRVVGFNKTSLDWDAQLFTFGGVKILMQQTDNILNKQSTGLQDCDKVQWTGLNQYSLV